MSTMNAALHAYLNDHLAGAASALAMLAHLSAAYADDVDVATFADDLRADVLADREQLERVMARLNVEQSGVRRAAAWAGEKLVELKVRLDDPGRHGLHLLELLEAVSLGVEGKRQLWLALAEAAAAAPGVGVADYEALRRRAEAQRARVERQRLAAARKALVP